MTKLIPDLQGVSKTMLWTLHGRASEAKRSMGIINDPDAIRIYDTIDFDFRRHFGAPDRIPAVRSVAFDRLVRDWLAKNPAGTIVSLGEGLETQVRRVDNGTLQWLSIDLADAISFRERFLPPTDRLRHVSASAFDRTWLDALEPIGRVLIVAQGLFMYFEAESTRRLLIDLGERFPDFEILFDTIPVWFSRLTKEGLQVTRHYKVPEMPWGIDQNEAISMLNGWGFCCTVAHSLSYRDARGLVRIAGWIREGFASQKFKRPSIIHAWLRGNQSETDRPSP